MNLDDLPVELLGLIVSYTVPNNWVFYVERQKILKLRLVCSKTFIGSPFRRFHS
jgi:hypothetical protein